MDVTGFDQLTQKFGAILSRRGLLRTGALGAAGLGLGLSTQHHAEAAKGKRGKKNKKGDVNKLCKTQVTDCETLLTSACGGDPKCLNTVQTCCPALSTCDLGGFLACLRATQV